MLLDDHGFAKAGVVFHRHGLFVTIGGDFVGRVDPRGDVEGYFQSVRIVDREGKEWRVSSWKKLVFAGLRHWRGWSSHEFELEQVGQVSLEELRLQMKAAMTPAAFEKAYMREDAQREALERVRKAENYVDLIGAANHF